MAKKMTITLDSIWNDADEVKEFQRKMAAEYGLEAGFNDGGCHYSSWTLTGPKAALRMAIQDEWLCGCDLGDIAVLMDAQDFKELYGVRAAKKYLYEQTE